MAPDEWHVVPNNDLAEHETSPRCWCKPVESADTPDLWLHNAFDGRELIETGKRLVQ